MVTPTVYINGNVAGTKTEFLLSSHNFANHEKQPEYVQQYVKARDAVYEELLQDALKTGDFDPLLSVITTCKEPALARRLMKELHAKKERYPDLIAGDARMVLGRIDATNNRITKVRQNAGSYALATARREFNFSLRHELNDDETGILKAAVLGMKIKFGRPRSKAKWVRMIIEEQLAEIMKLPSVPEQLVARERHGLPIS